MSNEVSLENEIREKLWKALSVARTVKRRAGCGDYETDSEEPFKSKINEDISRYLAAEFVRLHDKHVDAAHDILVKHTVTELGKNSRMYLDALDALSQVGDFNRRSVYRAVPWGEILSFGDTLRMNEEDWNFARVSESGHLECTRIDEDYLEHRMTFLPVAIRVIRPETEQDFQGEHFSAVTTHLRNLLNDDLIARSVRQGRAGEALDEPLDGTPQGGNLRTCPDCDGGGAYVGLHTTEDCETCGGRGQVPSKEAPS